MDITAKTAGELHSLLTNKEISATELTKAFLDRIRTVDSEVKAYVTVTEEKALQQAQKVDDKIQKGEEIGPLEGIPMALKDNICTEGIKTTCCSKMLENFVPPYSATVAEKLEEAGMVLLGKTNMDEFAMGSSTEHSYFFTTRNPWDLDRVPGGSSGGSSASVAADEAVYALGSDTGGSIRQPAALCGVVGIKPTYGLVSRYGVVACSSSLDHVGAFSKTVADNALILNAIAGYDSKDATSMSGEKVDYTQFLKDDVKGLKIGVPKEYFAEGIDPQVKQIIDEAIKTYEGLGAVIEECSLPHTEYVMAASFLISSAEASSNLARLDGVRFGHRAENIEDVYTLFTRSRSEGFGPEVKRRILLGTYVLSAGQYEDYYLKSQKVRTLIKNDFDKAFEKFDVLLSPTTLAPAFKIGEKSEDPVSMHLSDICTASANMAGIPALSLPAGFVDGLPVGMQLMGKAFDEGTLYKAAYAFEQNTNFHTVKPSSLKGGK